MVPYDQTPASDTESIGSVLSERYRILGVIGDGGMGRVYAAEHVTLRRRLAIKVLKPELSRVEANVERFLQEARAASMIAHPNVVDIIDFGRVHGGPVYFVMEFLEGEDLAMLLRRQVRLPWPRVQQIVLQVVRGLHAAHMCGVIHRDMKPANIYLVRRADGSEHVKLLDFGIAKWVSQDGLGSLTGEGSVFGTARYMSPEQASGLPVDGRSDVYAVGVLLYEMLTGRPPFDSDNFMRVATQHINEPVLPPRDMAPDAGIGEIVEALVMRALAKNPADRYASMADFEAAILGASFESTVAIHSSTVMPHGSLGADAMDRTTVYDSRHTPTPLPRPAGRAPAELATFPEATVVKPTPLRSSASRARSSARVVNAAPPAQPPVPAALQHARNAPGPPSPLIVRREHRIEDEPPPMRDTNTGEFLRPALPTGMDRPPSEPVEHRTLPPVNWHGGNPSTGENVARGEGAETHEFARHVPRREASRNWMVITISAIALALVWAGGATWFFLFDDEEQTQQEVNPIVVKDEPRPIAAPEPPKPQPPKTEPPAPELPPPVPKPPRFDPPPRQAERAPRQQDELDALGDRDLGRGFGKASAAIRACGEQHGAIAGTGFDVSFDVVDGRAINVEVQRPNNVTTLGRCVQAAVQSKARFGKARQPSTGVKRRVRF
jgi:serine/threonine protein kinase